MQYYKAASLFVLPSISEGMPTVILEAFYFNLPVITTDIPNLRDSFNDMAILVPPKNERAIAKQVLKLVNNQEYFYKINSNTRSYVESNYSWSILSKKYENIYKNLYDSHSQK